MKWVRTLRFSKDSWCKSASLVDTVRCHPASSSVFDGTGRRVRTVDAILDVGQESRLGQGPSVSVRAQSFQASMLGYSSVSVFSMLGSGQSLPGSKRKAEDHETHCLLGA